MAQRFKLWWQTQLESRLFAINPQLLGDPQQMAWSNLGLWHNKDQSYPQAAMQMAQYMGDALQLQPTDHILDLGCGYGASLLYWRQKFQVQQLTGMDIQNKCCQIIAQQQLPNIQMLHQSWQETVQQPHDYDVVLSLDCAYHVLLADYLSALRQYIKADTRIGFHFLVRSAEFDQLPKIRQKVLEKQLNLAKIPSQPLLNSTQLHNQLAQAGYGGIAIKDLSQPVLQGFANYIDNLAVRYYWSHVFDLAKIKMTAKLCANLYRSRAIRYVQVTAKFQEK